MGFYFPRWPFGMGNACPGPDPVGKVRPTVDIQMQFSGSAGAWTSVRADVRAETGIRAEYGIRANGPLDRVGDTGTLSFALNNAQNNSAKTLGYYSPGHSSVRSGFEEGIGTRVAFTYNSCTIYKWTGRLDVIDPLPGQYRQRITNCQAVDWMDDAARHFMQEVSTQASKLANELIIEVLGNMTRPPNASTLDTAQMEFPFALDDVRDESTTALGALQTIVQSDLGYLYLNGNQSAGGELVFHDRRRRFNPGTATACLTNTMVEMRATRAREGIYNRVKVTVSPRRADTEATTVLARLDSFPTISPSQSLTIISQYRDPLQEAQRVGGFDIQQASPNRDYTFGTAAVYGDDSLTSGCGLFVNAGQGGNSVYWGIWNEGTQTAYITKLEVRGKGLYTYTPITLSASNQTSQHARGLNTLTLAMPYEPSTVNAQNVADWLLSQYGTPVKNIDTLTFMANQSHALMNAFLLTEPGHMVELTETVTGYATNYFVNGVTFDVLPTDVVMVTWHVQVVTDSNINTYWVLGTGALGTSTKLAL